MKLFRLLFPLVLVIAGSAVAAAAASAGSGVIGQVYVNDNTAGVNTVAAFDRHTDGTLTAVAGSPFVGRRRRHRGRDRFAGRPAAVE